jgi:hypothetical protein
MAAAIQLTLAALAVAGCLFGTTSIATAENLFKIPGTDYYISLDAAQPLNTADSQLLLAARSPITPDTKRTLHRRR